MGLTRRGRERGAAVFIVVLVITMLTGVGLFAVRSSIVSTTASGHSRQMAQTHYVTEYAVLATAAELSTDRRQAYVRVMTKSPDCVLATDCKCKGVRRPGTNVIVNNKTCYIFGHSDLQAQLSLEKPGAKFITPLDETDPQNPIPGSLGHGRLESSFRVEMTDLAPANLPVAGTDLTSAGAAQVQFMSVTLSAIGEVRPTAATGSDKAAASIESARAHLIVGPLPKF